MSKIKIVGHASGSGVLTIAAPNTNTDRTITIPDVTGTLLDSGSDLPAANLTGTVADARFPATLPAKSGVNLTALNASNLGSGTLPDARFPATLPAISGASLTNLPADSTKLPLAGGTLTGALTINSTGNTPIVVRSTYSTGGYAELQLGASGATIGYLGSAEALVSGGAAADLSIRSQANLVFSTSGNSERIRIDSAGRLLIGDSATALATGGAAAGQMQLLETTGGGALRFNIGCGGASAEPRLDINTATTTTAAVGSINFSKTHHNTLTTLADVVQGEALGSINFSGVSRTNASYNRGAYIRAFVSDTSAVSSTYVPTDLWFATQDTSTDRSPGAATPPQMVIEANGKVGINGLVPSAALSVNGDFTTERTKTYFSSRTSSSQAISLLTCYLANNLGYWFTVKGTICGPGNAGKDGMCEFVLRAFAGHDNPSGYTFSIHNSTSTVTGTSVSTLPVLSWTGSNPTKTLVLTQPNWSGSAGVVEFNGYSGGTNSVTWLPT